MEKTWEEERKLQFRLISGVYHGETLADDDRQILSRLRDDISQQLREGNQEQTQQQIEEQIRFESQRLRNLEDGEASILLESPEGSPDNLYLETLAIGERLRWLRYLGDSLDGHLSQVYQGIIESELRWIESKARDLSSSPDGKLSTDVEKVKARMRESRHLLLHKTIVDWLVAGEDVTKNNANPSQKTVLPGENFEQLWERVLEYHEIISDVKIGNYSNAEKIESLHARRKKDISTCQTILKEIGDADRGPCIQQAIDLVENHVSSLLSEGDLLDTHGRIVKYRAAISAVDDFSRVLEGSGLNQKKLFSPGSIPSKKFKKELRSLKWVRNYADRTAKSSEVEGRMESKFGRKWVRKFENFVFILIALLVVLVVVEWRMDAASTLTPSLALGFQIADLLICSILLGDFFLRWGFAGWSVWFIKKHFIFDFLPALPYGFILGPLWFFNYYVGMDFIEDSNSNSFRLEGLLDTTKMSSVSIAKYAHLVLILRVFRLMRIFRGLRIFVTGLRLFRLLIFVIRGMDRAVQRFRGFLDRNILVFEKDFSTLTDEDSLIGKITQHESYRIRLNRELYREIKHENRSKLLLGHLSVLEFEIETLPPCSSRKIERLAKDRDLYVESLIVKLVNCESVDLENIFNSRDLHRLAALLRWMDLPFIRMLPLFRRWAVASRLPEASEAVAEAARQFGQFLQSILSVFYLGGDLSGITTGPQILDRVATAMIKSTQRPALRLIVIGGLTLVFSLFFKRMGWEIIEEILATLGLPFFILGSLCLVINILGRWFKRISGEALDIYLRTSEAHFFHLVKELKSQHLDKDLEDIHRRVVIPDCELRNLSPDEIESTLAFLKHKITFRGQNNTGSQIEDSIENQQFMDFLFREIEQVSLLYRDYLDGTLLHRSDDKTSIQILGNLAMRDIRFSMLGMGKKDIRRLERLALEKDRILGFGPYLWFRFISESLAIETAKMVMEYNSCCIPRHRLKNIHADLKERFDQFLEHKRKDVNSASRRSRRASIDFTESSMVTTEFHALHFLIEDQERDQRIERIFCKEVLDAMVKDRRAMVRDVFGTWPYHLIPRSVRRINPYRLYFRFLGGARIFLLPIVVLLKLLGLLYQAVFQLVGVVREVLGKEEIQPIQKSRIAGFEVAIRKINRMRKPYFMEAMRLRAAVDAEYLGLRIPGMKRMGDTLTYRDDLDFIGALESERLPFEELRRAAIRDLRRLRLFLSDRNWLGNDFSECLKTLDPENAHRYHSGEILRAMVSAFITDQHDLRSAITGPQVIREFFDEVVKQPSPGIVIRSWKDFFHNCIGLLLPGNRKRRRLFKKYIQLDRDLKSMPPTMIKKALHAFLDTDRMMVRYCEIAIKFGEHPDQKGNHEGREERYNAAVLEALRRVAADHALWGRKLITLRMIQTLTILDIRTYRQLIWTLGGFGNDDEKNSIEIKDSIESRERGKSVGVPD